MNDIEKKFISKFYSQKKQLELDDAACISKSATSFLVSQDTLCEDTHVDLNYYSPEQVAYKALQMNRSDMAAMGGLGEFILQSIVLPSKLTNDWISKYADAFKKHAASFNLEIIGGDMCRSVDRFMTTITIIDTQNQNPIPRNNSKPNDAIFITKIPGLAHLGLTALSQSQPDVPSIIRNATLMPEAQNELAVALNKTGLIHSMLDTSDSLLQSLEILCTNNNCGAKIYLEQIPSSDIFQIMCERLKLYPLDVHLNGGEDFGLLLTAPATLLTAFPRLPIYQIGEITTQKEIKYLLNGEQLTIKDSGYHHF